MKLLAYIFLFYSTHTDINDTHVVVITVYRVALLYRVSWLQVHIYMHIICTCMQQMVAALHGYVY